MEQPTSPERDSNSSSTRPSAVSYSKRGKTCLHSRPYNLRKRSKYLKSHIRLNHEAKFAKRQWLEKPAPFLQKFYEGEDEIVLKVENFRQSIGRATLGVIDYLRQSSSDEETQPTVLKGGFSGLIQIEDLVSKAEIWSNIAMAYQQNQEEIKQFIPPKTSFKAKTRGKGYEGNSWNNAKWTEFCNTDGISSIAWWVVRYIFDIKDLDKTCTIWKKSCCKASSKETGEMQSKEHGKLCEEKWRALKDHFLAELNPNDPMTLLKTRKLP